MADWALFAARVGVYLSVGLLAGLVLYRAVVRRDRQPLRRALVAGLVLSGIAFSMLWLLATASAIAGTSLSEPDWALVSVLAIGTSAGNVLLLRLALLCLLLWLPARPCLLALPAATALATVAWTGHAAVTEGLAGALHRTSDCLHLLAAMTWIGALVTFRSELATTGAQESLHRQLAQFAWPGSVIVAILLVTGLINLAMIVDISRISQLAASTYGATLGSKLLVFTLMLVLAGINRWRLVPRLRLAGPAIRRTLARTLSLEALAWLGAILLVAALGLMMPPA